LQRFSRFTTAAGEGNLTGMGLQIIPPSGQHQMGLAHFFIEHDQYPALARLAWRFRGSDGDARHGGHFHLGFDGIKVFQGQGLLNVGGGWERSHLGKWLKKTCNELHELHEFFML
jgi:hypothetical protein